MQITDLIFNTIASIFNAVGDFNLDTLAAAGNSILGWQPGATVKLVSFLISALLAIPLFKIISGLQELRRNSSAGNSSTKEALSEPDSLQALPEVKPNAIKSRWDEIVRHINSTNEPEWKLAILEADKLVDLTLRRAGFPGETLGEKLMNVKEGALESLQGLWDAHKIRNQIAHEPDFTLRYSEAKRALELYENTLKELGAL